MCRIKFYSRHTNFKKTKEKIELYKDISEEDIVKTGEKEALLEQTKTDTKTKLRSVQREEQKKKNKADAIEKNKKVSVNDPKVDEYSGATNQLFFLNRSKI